MKKKLASLFCVLAYIAFYYGLKHLSILNNDKHTIMRNHNHRHMQATEYLLNLPNISSVGKYDDQIVVCFISLKRKITVFEYLHQSVAALHYGFQKNNISATFMVAFASHELDDFTTSKFKWFKIPDLKPVTNESKWQPYCINALSCIEYYHYVSVLKVLSKYNASYILVLQDDALAKPFASSTLKYLIKTRLPNIRYSKPHLISMYAPDYYRKYPLTSHDICELIAFTYLVFFICKQIGLGKEYSFTISLLVFLICLIGGREIFYEHRRFFKFMFTLKPSYDCCIPAMLYVNPYRYLPLMVKWLLTHRDENIDVMIHRYMHKNCFSDLALEPTIFWHIGFDSAVDHPRSWKLFSSLPYNLF